MRDTIDASSKKSTSAERAYPLHGGRLIGRILKEHGVKYVFGIHGGHVWPLETGFYEFGIQRIHLRHEQTGPYAAEAFARCTRTPGLCYGTAGPGFTNMVSGIAQAYYNSAPVVAISGQHSRDQVPGQALQEAYPEEISKSFTRWAASIEDWRSIPLYLRKALHDCMVYPPKPIVLAIDTRGLMAIGDERRLIGDVSSADMAAPEPAGGSPKAIEKAVRSLLEAERPAIAAGEGLHWSDAGGELQELVELLNVPVHTRRVARGAVREDHRLSFTSGHRGRFLKDCDVMAFVGLQLGSLEAHGRPPVWPGKARRIVINESPEDCWQPLPTALKIIGSPKIVLQQMIDCAKGMIKEPPKRTAWLEWLDTCRRERAAWQVEAVAEFAEHKPVHTAKLAQDIVDVLDASATIVYDAHTGTSFLSERVVAKFSGQILDCGPWAGVGQGVGMGIGAQLARPGKPVLVLMGDGGMGVGGMDIETAARYKLPVVYVVCNNSTWMGGLYHMWGKGQVYPWDMLPDIRYDKMFEVCGCHAEHVEDPKDIKPALDRAFNSGKTAVVNVLCDERVFQPFHASPVMTTTLKRCTDYNKIPDEWREYFDKGSTTEATEELRRKGYPVIKPFKKGSTTDS